MAKITKSASNIVRFIWSRLCYFVAGCTSLVIAACYGVGASYYGDEHNNTDELYSRVQRIMDEGCNTCHSSETPAGSYATDSYEGLLGSGTDGIPNVIPGDASSKLLEVIFKGSETGDPVHNLSPSEYDVLYEWIVSAYAERD